MSRVRADFDSEAEQYDRWKQRNAYYYDAIKRLYRSRIPAGATVLEVGCGTGGMGRQGGNAHRGNGRSSGEVRDGTAKRKQDGSPVVMLL